MKPIIASLLLACLISTASAQQNKTANDSILLEYYQTQRYKEAADYLKTANPEPVTDDKIISSLAYTSQMAGKLADAEGYYQRLLLKDSTNIPVLFNLGNINIRRGNNKNALIYLKKILVKDSTNFNVYKQLANLSEGIADIGSTIAYLQKANKLNPVEPDVAFDLSKYYIGLKQLPLAEAVITAAYEADTLNSVLILGKARINYALNKHEETIRLCKKLVEGGDISYEVIKMLGTAYYDTKKYNECIAAFRKLDDTKSQNEASWYYIGMSYKALKDQPQAIAAFRKSIEEAVSPNVDSYYSEIADSFDKMGKSQSAASSYKKALQFDQKPMTYYAIAELYDARMRDTAAAISYYKKYLAANPPVKQKSYVDYAKDRVVRLRK